MAPLALQEGRRNQTRSSSFGKRGEKVAADFSRKKGRVKDERKRIEQAEGLDSGGVKGEVGAGDRSESRKAPDRGGVSKIATSFWQDRFPRSVEIQDDLTPQPSNSTSRSLSWVSAGTRTRSGSRQGCR